MMLKAYFLILRRILIGAMNQYKVCTLVRHRFKSYADLSGSLFGGIMVPAPGESEVAGRLEGKIATT
jgi:hypothetical protein